MEPKLKYLLFFMSKQRTLVKFGVFCDSFCGFLVSNQFEKNITFVVSCCFYCKIYKNMGLNKSRQNAVGGESDHQIFFQVEGFTHFICSSNWITNCSIWSKHTFLKETSHQKGNDMYFRCRTWSLNRLLCCYILVELKWLQMSWEFNY